MLFEISLGKIFKKSRTTHNKCILLLSHVFRYYYFNIDNASYYFNIDILNIHLTNSTKHISFNSST